MKKIFTRRKVSVYGLVSFCACLVWLCCTPPARAQQWTGCGANNTSVCTSSTTTNVGIGNTNPTNYPLTVQGGTGVGPAGQTYSVFEIIPGTAAVGQTTALRAFNANKLQLTTWTGSAYNAGLTIDTSGNIGIGTTSPNAYSKLQVNVATNFNLAIGKDTSPAAVGIGAYNDAFSAATGLNFNGSPIAFLISGVEKVRIDSSGNVGVGTASPQHKLDVSGSMAVGAGYTSSTTAPANGLIVQGGVGIGTSAPNTQQYMLDVNGSINVSGNINAKYQDVAEWVPSTQKLAAGTVVVLDKNHANQVLASTTSYDTAVAGVVSARPGITLGEGGEGRVPVATTGRVRVRVDATRAPIHVGDLLVTSGEEGVAMKSVPVDLGGVQIHRPGTIIGKALEPLEKGTGEILVLLSLQ